MGQQTKDLSIVRRGCTNTDIRAELVFALKTGVRYRMTKKGVILYGENGQSVVTHFTASDHRAVLNLRSGLRTIGIERPKK